MPGELKKMLYGTTLPLALATLSLLGKGAAPTGPIEPVEAGGKDVVPTALIVAARLGAAPAYSAAAAANIKPKNRVARIGGPFHSKPRSSVACPPPVRRWKDLQARAPDVVLGLAI